MATDEACLVGAFWKWGAQAVATGDEMVILGEHRIASGDVCEEGVQFAWTSADGEKWTIVDDLGIDGHAVGLAWFEDRYVAYGSPDEWFTWLLQRTPEIWTSTDLTTWERAVLDLSPMPDMGYISAFPDSERPWSPDSPTVDVETAEDALEVSFQVDIARPGPDAGISNVPELADWLLANRGSEYFDPDLDVIEQLEADLAMTGIDFPLDDAELDRLWHGYAAAERAGRFVAETSDGLTWTTRYED